MVLCPLGRLRVCRLCAALVRAFLGIPLAMITNIAESYTEHGGVKTSTAGGNSLPRSQFTGFGQGFWRLHGLYIVKFLKQSSFWNGQAPQNPTPPCLNQTQGVWPLDFMGLWCNKQLMVGLEPPLRGAESTLVFPILVSVIILLWISEELHPPLSSPCRLRRKFFLVRLPSGT